MTGVAEYAESIGKDIDAEAADSEKRHIKVRNTASRVDGAWPTDVRVPYSIWPTLFNKVDTCFELMYDDIKLCLIQLHFTRVQLVSILTGHLRPSELRLRPKRAYRHNNNNKSTTTTHE